jgi:hypothetical protein
VKRREFLATVAVAPAAAAALQSEDGFQPLFDGQSLSGWQVVDGPDSAFYVEDGSIVASQSSQYPAWLRSTRSFENFDFRCEFFIRGWIDGGVYIHAPLHGRASWVGMLVNIFHQVDEKPRSNSMGAIFPLVAPSLVNVKNRGEWNTMRILMDWPRLQVWTNDAQIHDLDLESQPELRYRLRQGYFGLSGLGYPIRFRNMRVRELPAKEQWENLYVTQSDFAHWFISESTKSAPARFQALGGVLRAEGGGNLATKNKYKNFELQLYIRGPKEHNGGIFLRSKGPAAGEMGHYEIQVHNVEEAHYPTGSLYHFKRSVYPRIQDDEWYLMQIRVQDRTCVIRVNGDTVLEYDQLENLDEGMIEIQAHRPGSWLEFKEIRAKRL